MLGGWGHLRPITCNETWSHIFKYERMSNVILIYIYIELGVELEHIALS